MRANNRKKAVVTILSKNPNYFKEMAAKSVANRNTSLHAKRASWANHYPERFDDQGEVLPEWQDEFNKTSGEK